MIFQRLSFTELFCAYETCMVHTGKNSNKNRIFFMPMESFINDIIHSLLIIVEPFPMINSKDLRAIGSYVNC
jgi:hypothetical protein